ncbi:MAG: RsmD family RNA methyltransferase [Oligoflexia bacterium]|nr:RsmD family RNA methyltransferase [Oligoflexia bacterium]
MSIKILGGIAKGFALKTPREISFRPTSVMLKRKVFDCYQNLQDYHFVDLCSGSGSIGIEAWSRGALEIFLVEDSTTNIKILSDNLQKIKIQFAEEFAVREIHIIKNRVEKWIKSNFVENMLSHNKVNKINKIIFYFDPPYQEITLYLNVIDTLKSVFKKYSNNSTSNSISNSNLEMWIESDTKKGITPEKLKELNLKINKLFFQGSKFIAITTL